MPLCFLQRGLLETDVIRQDMLQDIIRATVTRIIQDKLLLGLVIVGILSIFVGGFATSDEKAGNKNMMKETADQPPSDNKGGSEVAKLDPSLATDFVKWWMSGAMDYSAASAAANHEAAFRWMTPEAMQSFRQSLWTPDTASGVAQGLYVAAFQPVSVQAAAVNPDGSVVVTLSGTLVTQASERPFTQQLQMDLLVRKESDGLRIAGVYNRVASVPGSSAY
jgi:hypothetical protein